MKLNKWETMAAPKGNQLAKKLTTPELKADAYRQYCEHIATGLPKECWTFKHDEMKLTSKTMEKYIRESPHDFPPIHKEFAEHLSYMVWIRRGISMMMGEIKGCQPAIFQMFMRNKFSWDKESYVTHSVEPEFRELLKIAKSEQKS